MVQIQTNSEFLCVFDKIWRNTYLSKNIFQVGIFTRPLKFSIRYVPIISIYDLTVALKKLLQ